MKRILIVDDEIQILKVLTRVFYDTEYQVFTVSSGEEALSFLETNEVNMIISDMRMPYMDGYQLLSIIKDKYPKIIRTILSGYSDESIIFKALLYNVAKAYFYKPCDNKQLLESVNKLFEVENILNDKNLLYFINSMDELPTIKLSYQKIISMINDNEDIQDIAFEIEKDLSLSTKLLHIANSAFYNLKTGSVKQAVLFIGMHNLKNLIYATSIFLTANEKEKDNIYFISLWEHSLLTNNIVHYIYNEYLHKKLPNTAPIAGLLHNIGVMILLKYYGTRYLDCKDRVIMENNNLIESERIEFNVTHQELGGYLTEWWELPFPMIEVALFHHNPLNPNIINRELVSCVHIAQHYAEKVLNQPNLIEFNPLVFNEIGINEKEFNDKFFNINWNVYY